jgi:hypothetical protein
MFLRDIINDANRSNSSFYPIDPGASRIRHADQPGPTLTQDARSLRTHQDAMRTSWAQPTASLSWTATDLDMSLRKISDDLTSYYLLGALLDNGKLDGGTPPRCASSARAWRYGHAAAIGRAECGRNRARPEGGGCPSAVTVASRFNPPWACWPGSADVRVRLWATPAPGGDLLWIAGEVVAVRTERRVELWARRPHCRSPAEARQRVPSDRQGGRTDVCRRR